MECVTCYAKGVSYHVGQKMHSSNHEYNVINLDNKWYPIDFKKVIAIVSN